MRVLVIGAGQLSLMLAEAGSRLGIQVDRLDPFSGDLRLGTSTDVASYELDALLAKADVITAEIEHLPDNALVQRLMAATNFPAARALTLIADRLPQKQLLDELQVATAPWLNCNNSAALDQATKQFNGEMVLKRRRGGYDGRGTLLCDTNSPRPSDDWLGDTIVEQRIPFQRELSIVGARNAQGECVFYPLTENLHRQGILRLSLAPAAVRPEQQQEAQLALQKIMTSLDYVGVMALECFDTGEQLLANEVAPRVHNSTHWTQAGTDICQFALHLRALTGLPLPTPTVFGPHAMVNLIGTSFADALQHSAGHRLHWYGKEPRPGRKVGHINMEHADAQELTRRAEQLLEALLQLK
jgi:5-(carboxyamino)imidazole ribonucleotide synthase